MEYSLFRETHVVSKDGACVCDQLVEAFVDDYVGFVEIHTKLCVVVSMVSVWIDDKLSLVFGILSGRKPCV